MLAYSRPSTLVADDWKTVVISKSKVNSRTMEVLPPIIERRTIHASSRKQGWRIIDGNNRV